MARKCAVRPGKARRQKQGRKQWGTGAEVVAEAAPTPTPKRKKMQDCAESAELRGQKKMTVWKHSWRHISHLPPAELTATDPLDRDLVLVQTWPSSTLPGSAEYM